MNDENTNKNPNFYIDDDDDSLGHQSLTEDREIDIDEYEAVDRNPVVPSEVLDEDNDAEDDDEDLSLPEQDISEVVLSKSKVLMIKSLLASIEQSQQKILDLLAPTVDTAASPGVSPEAEVNHGPVTEAAEPEGNVVEGVFNGENMIGNDGKEYSIPSNYASKSKLVEGDLLKLTITDKGTFIYKQIKPIERKRVIGVLEKMPDGSFIVTHEGKRWRVITASVTYFKGETGDEIVILVPKEGSSQWGAVENIIKIHN